jgi:hypothetical protein
MQQPVFGILQELSQQRLLDSHAIKQQLGMEQLVLGM